MRLLLIAALALMLALSLASNVYAARESVQVTRLANAVTIDGKWTTSDEWSDTYRVSMHLVQGSKGTGYVRFKHDTDFVYILVDLISDTTEARLQTSGNPAADALNMGIDLNVNDTKTSSDLTIQLSWNNGKSGPEAVSPPWVQGTISLDATNDPDSKTPHAIYELAIPMGTFEMNSAVRISVWDPGTKGGLNMHWPRFQGSWDTKYYGDLVFSEVVVPELPLPALVLLLSLIVTCTIAKRRKGSARVLT